MVANIGSLDRTVRFVLGIVLLAAPFVPPAAGALAGLGAWRFAVAGVGAVLFLTALLRVCPAYSLFGIRTCELGRS